MKVLITGASGFIGSALGRSLHERGHDVSTLRRGDGPQCWDVERGVIDREAVVGQDAIFHLAGESVGGRWTRAKKARILDSRVAGTRLIARTAADLGVPTLISGSAMGFYGDRGDEELTEQSGPGDGFLSDVVQKWEAAAEPAVIGGVRTVLARTALVLDAAGGSFARMLLPFRLGVGGRIGSGRQWWSWITLADEVSALIHCMENQSLAGPVNLASPHPLQNASFVKVLAKAMKRPALVPVPAAALRLALGAEFAREVLLASQRLVPTVLASTGFVWAHPTPEQGMEAALR